MFHLSLQSSRNDTRAVITDGNQEEKQPSFSELQNWSCLSLESSLKRVGQKTKSLHSNCEAVL